MLFIDQNSRRKNVSRHNGKAIESGMSQTTAQLGADPPRQAFPIKERQMNETGGKGRWHGQSNDLVNVHWIASTLSVPTAIRDLTRSVNADAASIDHRVLDSHGFEPGLAFQEQRESLPSASDTQFGLHSLSSSFKRPIGTLNSIEWSHLAKTEMQSS